MGQSNEAEQSKKATREEIDAALAKLKKFAPRQPPPVAPPPRTGGLFDELKAQPRLAFETILGQSLVTKVGSREPVALCPFHDDHHPSLSINLEKLTWFCRSKCQRGGGVIDLAKEKWGLNFRGVAERLETALGLSAQTNGSKPQPVRMLKYDIRNLDGDVVATHLRHEFADGSKAMPWSTAGIKTPELPLFHIEKTYDRADGEAIIVCEGEKAALSLWDDHNQTLAVGTVTGAKQIPNDESLKPLCRFKVFLWPDNDDDGYVHMNRIGERLLALGHTDIWKIKWADAPLKGDAADFGGGDVGQLIEAAERFTSLPAKAGGQLPAVEGEEQITALHLEQLYAVIDQWEQVPWVWDGILPRSSLSIIVGKSETGKSTLIYSLIYAIVTGQPFFGRHCQKGRCIYLAGDPMSEIVAGRTFRKLGLTEGVVVVPDALVMNPTGMKQLRALVKEIQPSLIVGDTMAATVDLDVDKYGASYKAQLPLTRLARDFGPNFLLSHHSQKSAIDSYGVIDAALGSVGVAAVASSRMATRMYRRKGNKYFTFEMSNLRIGKPLEGEWIIKMSADGTVDLGSLWKAETVALDKDIIISVLAKRGAATAKRTLWQECRPKPKWDPFNDALDELFAEGKIAIETGPRGASLYKLP